MSRRRVIPLAVDLSAPPAATRAMPPPPKSPLARARSPGEGARPPTGGSVGLAGGFDRLLMMRQVNMAVAGPTVTASGGAGTPEASAALNHRQRMVAEQQRRQELALMAREDYTGTVEGQERLQRQEERSRMKEEELRMLQLLEAERQAERARQRQCELEEEARVREQYLARVRAQREEQQRAAEEKEAARKLAVERKMRSLKKAADAKARAEFAEKQWVLQQEALLARERHQAAMEAAQMQVEDVLGLAMQHEVVAERERQQQIAAEQEEWRAFQQREQDKQREATRARRAAMAQQYEQDKQRRMQIHKLQRERAAQQKERRSVQQQIERPGPENESVGASAEPVVVPVGEEVTSEAAAAKGDGNEERPGGEVNTTVNLSHDDEQRHAKGQEELKDRSKMQEEGRAAVAHRPERAVETSAHESLEAAKDEQAKREQESLAAQPLGQSMTVQGVKGPGGEVPSGIAVTMVPAAVVKQQEPERGSVAEESAEREAPPIPTDPSGGITEAKAGAGAEPEGNTDKDAPLQESRQVEDVESKLIPEQPQCLGSDVKDPKGSEAPAASKARPSGPSPATTSTTSGKDEATQEDNDAKAANVGARVEGVQAAASPRASQSTVTQEGFPVAVRAAESAGGCMAPDAATAPSIKLDCSASIATEATPVRVEQHASAPREWSVASARAQGVVPFAQVRSVTEHSPAMQAALCSGDLLVDFGGVVSSTPKCLMAMAECVQKNVNCVVSVGLLRQSDVASPTGTVRETDRFREVRVALRPHKWKGKGLLGCQLSPFAWPDPPPEATAPVAASDAQDAADGSNVVVLYDIVAGSVAEQAGLLDGDLLAGCGELELGGTDVAATMAAVAEHIRTTRATGAVVHLDIHRWIVDEQCYRLLHVRLPGGHGEEECAPLGCSLTSFSEYYQYLASSSTTEAACTECYYTTLTTALHAAALNGHAKCLELLLASLKQQGAAGGYSARDYLDWRDEDGRTPLFYACYASQLDCVRFLLEQTAGAGAGVGTAGTAGSGADWYGDTVLHAAASSGDAAVVALVLESALVGVDERNHARLSCAHVAPNVEVLALLGERFEADLLATDAQERMPLAYACVRDDVASVEYLCRKHPDFVDYADAQGNTPLHVAAWLGRRDAADVLVRFLPSIALYVTNADGRNAAEEARASGMPDVAAFLERAMAAADATATL